MVRVLVSGASGFVGARLCARLARDAAQGADELVLFTLSRRPPARDWGGPGVRHQHAALDLADARAVATQVRAWRPERVFHLGGLAHPGDCALDPVGAQRTNVGGTAALLTPLLESGARALFVSTAQVYGPARSGAIDEGAELDPRGAYAWSKLGGEQVARDLAQRGLHVAIARPFNHSAPEQSTRYVLPALVAELRAAAAEGRAARTGNLFPRRDFLHVEDVLEAYLLLCERAAAGAAYNVCRGVGTSIGEVFERLRQRIAPGVPHEFDPERQRAADAPEIYGSPARLAALGFAPRVSLDELLDDLAR